MAISMGVFVKIGSLETPDHGLAASLAMWPANSVTRILGTPYVMNDFRIGVPQRPCIARMAWAWHQGSPITLRSGQLVKPDVMDGRQPRHHAGHELGDARPDLSRSAVQFEPRLRRAHRLRRGIARSLPRLVPSTFRLCVLAPNIFREMRDAAKS